MKMSCVLANLHLHGNFRRVILAVGTMLACFTVLACQPSKYDNSSGTILFVGHRVQSYRPNLGELSELQRVTYSNYPIFPACIGGVDTFFAKTPVPAPNSDTFMFPICLFDWSKDKTLSERTVILSRPLYQCHKLQFVPKSGHYLFSGKVNGENALIEFNSNWQIEQRLYSSQLLLLGDESIDGAYQLSSGKLIMQMGTQLYVTSWKLTDAYPISTGLLRAVSYDGRFVLFKQVDGDAQRLIEYDAGTDNVRTLFETADDVLDISYSPDSKWLAYRKRLNWAFGALYLFMYNRETQQESLTWVSSTDGFVWLDDN